MDSPLVLSMCDTLLQRSEESGDKHMQIISYCIKLDYFYYKNDEENILKQTDEVKKVCLRLDNLKYYYFAWGGRLITYDFMRGTGLGLPICRLLAEKFGGSLVIDADYTQRCCFVLRLPWVHKEVSDHRLHGFTHI